MKPRSIAARAHSIEKKLCEKYQDPTLCNQYSWWILEAITGQKKEQLITRGVDDLNDAQLEQLNNWMHKLRDQNMPLQYLLGSLPFLDLDILVRSPILIPRPETEEMCAQLIGQLTKLNNQKITLLDIGTGSGCIALAFAKALPDAHVYATDISQEALELAQQNAEHNNVNTVRFLSSDVFTNIPTDLKFDIIISNPPYISPEEWNTLDPSVTQWEDRAALVARNKGLEIIERIIKQAPAFLKENKEMEQRGISQLVLEIGHQQGHAVKHLLENAGFDAITIKKDLEGKDRIVFGRIKHVAVWSKKE